MQRFVLIGFTLLLALSACQGLPPTMVVMVITATPTTDTAPTTDEAQADATEDASATNIETEAVPTATRQAATPAPTVSGVPTATISEIQVAEQVFENGRMMWLSPTNQIWVMILNQTGSGEWKVYESTFADGDPEDDPSLQVPNGKLQPIRGFGKLWRDNPDIREALGWATTPEFGYISRYEYHPGSNNGPGYHILFSLYGEAFRFNEASEGDWTWQLNK